MSQIERRREVVCVCISQSAVTDMEFPGFVFLRDSCSHVTEVGGTHVCETRATSFYAKRRRLRGCNLAILLARCLPHVPTTTGTFLLSRADFCVFHLQKFMSSVTSYHATIVHSTITYKLVATKILSQSWKQTKITLFLIPRIYHNQGNFFSYDFMHQVKVCIF
jgi:hypothetical protein